MINYDASASINQIFVRKFLFYIFNILSLTLVYCGIALLLWYCYGGRRYER